MLTVFFWLSLPSSSSLLSSVSSKEPNQMIWNSSRWKIRHTHRLNPFRKKNNVAFSFCLSRIDGRIEATTTKNSIRTLENRTNKQKKRYFCLAHNFCFCCCCCFSKFKNRSILSSMMMNSNSKTKKFLS
mgnify:CR=1 FL=1